MKASISLPLLYEAPQVFHEEKEVAAFFKNMKDEFCHDLETNGRPLIQLGIFSAFERLDVRLKQSEFNPKETGYEYEGTFYVTGEKTRILYDEIHVEMDSVPFMTKVPSLDDYLASTFKLRYMGSFAKRQDIEELSLASGKPTVNERMLDLNAIYQEMGAPAPQEFALEIASRIRRRPYEVHRTSHGSTQKTGLRHELDQAERIAFLSELVRDMERYNVSLRLIDNELIEFYDRLTGTIKTPKRKLA